VSLSAVDVHGCTAQDTIVVNYVPFNDPFPVITPGPNAGVCDGESLVLDVQSGYFSYLWSTGDTTQTTTVSSAGTYTVTVANGYGCSAASLPVTVSVLPTPTPTVTLVSGVLTTGSYTSYQWFLGASPISGAISQTYEPVVAGWYSVTVVDGNGCEGSSDAIFVNPVGVDDAVHGIAGLSLYPNPTMDVLNLRTLQPIDWPVTVEVWDMYGHKVKAYDMAHLMDVATMDMSDLAAAAYTLKVTAFRNNKTQQTVLRFVKE
jgi:hypothetical protein